MPESFANIPTNGIPLLNDRIADKAQQRVFVQALRDHWMIVHNMAVSASKLTQSDERMGEIARDEMFRSSIYLQALDRHLELLK